MDNFNPQLANATKSKMEAAARLKITFLTVRYMVNRLWSLYR